MNADTQAITLELTSKIAHLAVLFRAEFPSAGVDLQPWLMDQRTEGKLDPYSIDLSFYFPSQSATLACRCVLMQVRFSEALVSPHCRLLGLNASGFASDGQPQWQFSTTNWQFGGVSVPTAADQDRFTHLTRRILRLFKQPSQIEIERDCG